MVLWEGVGEQNFPMGHMGFGDGTRVKFWLDVRCGDMSLKESFPKLYLVIEAPLSQTT